MSRITTNEFMDGIFNALQKPRGDGDKEKPGLTDSSAALYLKTLFNLNEKKPFKSLAFLKKTDAVDAMLAEYSDNTKKTMLGVIVGVLTLKKLKGYGKALEHYRGLLGIKAKELRELEGTNVKTEKQAKNWVSSEEIEKLKNTRWTELAGKLGSKAKIAPELYRSLLAYLIVSLYTDISPRRNQDYLKMVVVKKYKDDLPTDRNYLDLTGNRFVFNVYKTARKYGKHIVNITPELETVLKRYLKYHPGRSSFANGTTPLLVDAENKPLTAVNAITRVLNKWFGKNIGSSMLRHIWLSSKYNIDEMKQDAADMGHSVEQQKGYMKSDSKNPGE